MINKKFHKIAIIKIKSFLYFDLPEDFFRKLTIL